MPAPGAKPKDADKKLGHTPVTHEWTQVPNRAYAGEKPRLPRSRPVLNRDGVVVHIKLCTQTKNWWADLSSMPHCALWAATDWRFAIETALLADMFFQGDRPAGSELRLREKIMGTTIDARRDLRVRYIDPRALVAPDEEGDMPAAEPGSVTDLGARRARLTSA